MSTTCLYTTVVNLSGTSKYFGFLPPHGKELANNESVTIWGSLQRSVDRQGKHLAGKNSLEIELNAGRLCIVEQPSVHLYDDVLENTKILTLVNGSLGIADSCAGSCTSSSTSA